MNDEGLKKETTQEQPKPTDGPGQDPTAQVPPVAPVLKKIVTANGEEVVLQEYQSALVVMQDIRDGSLSIYDIQNCANRATAKMLLNEALDHYRSQAAAAATATMLAKIAAQEPKKKGFVMPFGKKD
jgi:hypothetical protein